VNSILLCPPRGRNYWYNVRGTRCPSDMTACANRFLWKTFDTRTSELQCENM
jgi:hypothetical protein